MTTPPPARVAVRYALVFLGLLALALLLWRVWYAVLLGFGGVLFGVFLRHLAHHLHRWTRLPMRGSVVACAVALLALVILAVSVAGAAVAGQLSELGEALTSGAQRVRGILSDTAWGRALLDSASQGAQGGGMLLRIPSLMFTVVDALLGLVIVVFAGLYLAIEPRLYVKGAVRLFPASRQPRMEDVLHRAGQALWLWLRARIVVMVVVALVTWAGLQLVGVPLAMPLALVAGLLEFIPFFGSILAAVPILMVALTVDPMTTLYALFLVLAIQQLEGNVLAPLVEQKAVSLPPALILVAAIAFLMLFGPLGAVLASPLLVVAMVGTQMLYVEDALGQQVEVIGTEEGK
ncbi:AI-2E family transporter [Ramlibacter sp. AN1015]|uniref:AI-2E family transporter n=1 Tax=Ramlibacter sp. AN1015 TaxID=3133428 RepID=UPI0030BF3616